MINENRPGEIFYSQLSRRSLIKGATIAGAAIATHQLHHGITLSPLPTPTYKEATPEQREVLVRDSILTVAHRAGNTRNGIKNAANAGIDLADGDLSKAGGKIYLDHGYNFGILGRVVFGFDKNTERFRTGEPDLTVEEAIDLGSKHKIGMFWEIKENRGGVNARDIERMYGLAVAKKVKLFLMSNTIETVRMIGDVISDYDRCVFDPYTIYDWGELRQVKQEYMPRLLTTPWWINKHKPWLREVMPKVFVDKVNTAERAIEMQGLGFVDGYINETSVLEAIFTS